MKFHKLPKAQILPEDPSEMCRTIQFLERAGITARRPSPYQLKLDERTSYYPNRGTLFVDGEGKPWPERGIAALKAWIEKPSHQFRLED